MPHASKCQHAASASAPIRIFEAPPATGQFVQIVPGVYWMRMPLPFAINHINLWALEDGDGWAIVDTGIGSEETAAAWRSLFARAPDKRPLKRIFVTHMHPDHIGMAGWLARKFRCQLWITRLEYLHCRVLVSDTGREAPPDGVAFYRRAGWSDGSIETYHARFGNFGRHIHCLPDSFRRIKDGEDIMIGGHRWLVVVGAGHSPEHACFYCPELKLFISGDQVIPRISSNVSVYPIEPDADPMAEWIASLEKLKREVPDDVIVLPSHNEGFRGLHGRIDQLAQAHERAIGRLRRALREPKRAVDVFDALFARTVSESDVALLSLATGESVAALNFLINRGEATRSTDAEGVVWYRLATT